MVEARFLWLVIRPTVLVADVYIYVSLGTFLVVYVVCTYLGVAEKAAFKYFSFRKCQKRGEKKKKEIGNWRELAVSSCLLDK